MEPQKSRCRGRASSTRIPAMVLVCFMSSDSCCHVFLSFRQPQAGPPDAELVHRAVANLDAGAVGGQQDEGSGASVSG